MNADSIFQIIVTAIVQGITEFLPISSSGHLLIARKILSFQTDQANSFFEVFLHGGTLLSILIFWRNDIAGYYQEFKTGKIDFLFYVLIGSIPAALIGLFFKSDIDLYFFNLQNLNYLVINYFILSLILLSTRFIKKSKYNELYLSIVIVIGISQAFAILPGISRSGITITAGLLLGLNSRLATKYSFLLALPILFFSFFESLVENFHIFYNQNLLFPLFVGFTTSFIFGYIAITLLVNMVAKKQLWYFSIYCISMVLVLGYYYGF